MGLLPRNHLLKNTFKFNVMCLERVRGVKAGGFWSKFMGSELGCFFSL